MYRDHRGEHNRHQAQPPIPEKRVRTAHPTICAAANARTGTGVRASVETTIPMLTTLATLLMRTVVRRRQRRVVATVTPQPSRLLTLVDYATRFPAPELLSVGRQGI
jgi:hypothetical protein